MPAPVKHTCPDIDKALKLIKSIWSEAKDVVEDRYSRNAIEGDLDIVAGILEQLRSDNDMLRTWGKEMEEEKESAESYAADLEAQIEQLKQPA